ncbi:MAG: right-handed parallel beta-helix repeat-containing protein, partial [Candidatus Hodarchaeota archaeon]
MPSKFPNFILICIIVTGLLVGVFLFSLNPQSGFKNDFIALSSNPALPEDSFPTRAPIDPDILAGRTFLPHTPIEIAKNADFNVTNGVTAGDGSAGDPFIIEGWNITISNVTGIYIHDTSDYFVIQDCFLNGNWTSTAGGIYIENVASSTANVTSNICIYMGNVAIMISGSTAAHVTSNYCEGNSQPLEVDGSDNINVSHNIYNDHSWGVEISSTNFLIFYNNTVNESFFGGVEIFACSSPLLENNTISRNGYWGISLTGGCDNLRLINNTFTDDGLFTMWGYDTLVNADLIADNLINGKPLGIFIGVQDLSVPSSYGQVFLINCTNVTVENQNCSSSSMGIALYECKDCQIKNNTCSNNDQFGVYAYNSNGTIIKNNTLNGDWTGVRLWESNYTTIYNNTMK